MCLLTRVCCLSARCELGGKDVVRAFLFAVETFPLT